MLCNPLLVETDLAYTKGYLDATTTAYYLAIADQDLDEQDRYERALEYTVAFATAEHHPAPELYVGIPGESMAPHPFVWCAIGHRRRDGNLVLWQWADDHGWQCTKWEDD